MDLGKILSLFVILAKIQAARNARLSMMTFDKSNFNFIANGVFEVKNYIDIDERYNVAEPPGGDTSGGAFIFDKKPDGCTTPFPVSVQASLVLQTSFWCDPNNSSLRIVTECNGGTERILCDGALTSVENGHWKSDTWSQYCAQHSSVSIFLVT